MIFAQVLASALFGVFHYSGRSDRLEHWAFTFLTAALVLGIFILQQLHFEIGGRGILVILMLGLWFLAAHIALFVRRLHDQNRSGLFMLIPLSALTVLLTGWLGMYGRIPFMHDWFLEYGYWILLGGRSLCIISGGMLASVFIAEGDEGDNYYGEPVQ